MNNNLKKLIAQYKATGHVVFVYPRLKRIKLNGYKLLSYSEAIVYLTRELTQYDTVEPLTPFFVNFKK